MQKKYRWEVIRSFVIIMVCVVSFGCTTQKALERRAKAKELVEQKKANYLALKKAISHHTLEKGTTADEITALYGSPDDIFSSGSGLSVFEVWSYEKITTGSALDVSPIRLYFNDNRLVTWDI